mgnify:CR=1 FL=1|jgi:hypothetical protein
MTKNEMRMYAKKNGMTKFDEYRCYENLEELKEDLRGFIYSTQQFVMELENGEADGGDTTLIENLEQLMDKGVEVINDQE